MKIKFLALSIAFAAASVALSFCSKEPVQPVSSTVTTVQNDVEEHATDRACSVTIVVTAGGPVVVTTAAGAVYGALLNVPLTITTGMPDLLTFTGPNFPNGNSTVSVTGAYNLVGFNLAPTQTRRVGVSPNCGVALSL
jgi:hypothetical protein